MFRDIYPVVMCGGSGTRLWPLSRSGMPKQFLPLAGDKSLFVQALERVGHRYGFKAPIVIANNEHRFLLAKQADDAGLARGRIILEPMGRNTAPAVIVAALEAIAQSPDANILVLSADHLITDVPAFHDAVERAAAAARGGYLTCFGIHPTSAETGYGYINPGEALSGTAGAHRIASFKEKPDAATAQAYLASKEYLWNSGMFMFGAQTLLDEAEQHVPEMVAACRDAFGALESDLQFHRLPEDRFAKVPANSIDYAIMEKTSKAAVVPCAIGWSDLGSFSALHDTGEADGRGNVTKGDVTLLNSSDCLVYADKRLVTATDISNLVIVATDDAVMVTPKDKDQNVKQIVEALKANGRDEAKLHTTVYRPWGFYTSLAINSHFQVKELCVYPGKRLSLQSHNRRAEHWVVIEGQATVTRDDDIITLNANESVYLPVGTRHRLENKNTGMLRLVEVQTGDYFGEDDIIRYEDDYRRSSV
ncbi:mannose-1-phosphate guanylyltransferase/mannose-6-phosphate isomerase [Kordiimonas gwangyangensis]|uniref:mannose-1-phosphate guanylyltransferase/mannose-6-phosphate isomerase n=1 Tax=Kordiimonas gwangyangensis TaxID=288022 RepID=UPI000477ADE1|nr:mannose-1-phosphate guanylyltransferase/mannose-6-phosphate isomerase [Kordiimonas gwangyangensis]